MHHPRIERPLWTRVTLPALLLLLAACAPELSWAQTSPFMTGATALQTNILAWLTPVRCRILLVSLILFGIFVEFNGAHPLEVFASIKKGAFGSWFAFITYIAAAAGFGF